ncbi:hypothetical protein ACX6VE_003896, partial [Acinetobacter baumannii]
PVLHLGPWRQAADLQDEREQRCRGPGNLHRQLQRQPETLGRREDPGNGSPPAGLHQLPDRRPGPPARQSAGAVEHHSGRFAHCCAQWHHANLRHPPAGPGRADARIHQRTRTDTSPYRSGRCARAFLVPLPEL